MGVILLAQPKVSKMIQLNAEYVSARFNGEIKDPAPVLNFAANGEITTSSARLDSTRRLFEKTRWYMPKDAIPVRRSGFLASK